MHHTWTQCIIHACIVHHTCTQCIIHACSTSCMHSMHNTWTQWIIHACSVSCMYACSALHMHAVHHTCMQSIIRTWMQCIRNASMLGPLGFDVAIISVLKPPTIVIRSQSFVVSFQQWIQKSGDVCTVTGVSFVCPIAPVELTGTHHRLPTKSGSPRLSKILNRNSSCMRVVASSKLEHDQVSDGRADQHRCN